MLRRLGTTPAPWPRSQEPDAAQRRSPSFRATEALPRVARLQLVGNAGVPRVRLRARMRGPPGQAGDVRCPHGVPGRTPWRTRRSRDATCRPWTRGGPRLRYGRPRSPGTAARPRHAPVIDAVLGAHARAAGSTRTTTPAHGLLAPTRSSTRRSTPLGDVLPVLREGLLLGRGRGPAHHGRRPTPRAGCCGGRAPRPSCARPTGWASPTGAAWSRTWSAPTAWAPPLVTRRPVQVHSAEHFVRTPPRLDLRGRARARPARRPAARRGGRQRAAGAPCTRRRWRWVGRWPRLAEARAAGSRHLELAGAAAVGGGAAAGPARRPGAGGGPPRLDGRGHRDAARRTGSRCRRRWRPGRMWLPSLGLCAVEPLPGGWLIRVARGRRRAARPRAGWCWT